MKEATKKQKRLYLILLIGTVMAVILAVTLSLVFGLRGASDVPDPGGPSITEPDDTDAGTKPDPNDGTDPDPNDGTDPDPNDGTDPDDELVSYAMPLNDFQPGQECSLDIPVWSNTFRWFEPHKGTDFIAETGTPVMSIYDGTVASVGYSTLDGYYVIIENDDGIRAVYKSLTADILVEKGETVKTGRVIGAVGTSMGREQADGAHLHLELLENGKNIDPMTKLNPEEK